MRGPQQAAVGILSARDTRGDEVRYGSDVELIHCAERDCDGIAFESWGWRCLVHREETVAEVPVEWRAAS